MKIILIVSGYPDITNDSVANKAALEEFQKLRPEAEIDRLDTLCPDYKIDVEVQQAKLVAADIIVLQCPVFWRAVSRFLSFILYITLVIGELIFTPHAEYDRLVSLYTADRLTELLEQASPLLPAEYHKVWRSYQSRKNRGQADKHTKELMRQKVKRLQAKNVLPITASTRI